VSRFHPSTSEPETKSALTQRTTQRPSGRPTSVSIIAPTPSIDSFAVPAIAPHVVPRARLDRLLEDASSRVLTLVSAPAGTGKTTAVATWARSRPSSESLLWISLTTFELSPDTPWGYVSAGLKHAGIGRPGVDVSDRPIVVVMDCASDLSRTDIRKLSRLLDGAAEASATATPRIRLVLITRSDPAFDLDHFRHDGRLSEIRFGELAFSGKEAEQLFAARGLDLSAHEVGSMVSRTRGWAAGLALAARTLARSGDARTVARHLGDTPGPVSEYLLAEILNRQDPDVRRVLLRTSVAQSLRPGLVTDLAGARTEPIIAALAHGNVLIEQMPAGDGYRYHPLLKEMLQAQLSYETPDEARALHCRAAEHSADAGFVTDAVRSALAGDSWVDAVRYVIDHAAIGYVLTPQGSALQSLLRPIPAELTGPDSAVIRAALAAARRRPDECGQHLDRARDALSALGGSTATKLAIAVTASVHATLSEDWGAGRAALASADKLRADHDAARHRANQQLDIVLDTARAHVLSSCDRLDEATDACREVIARGMRRGFEGQYLDCLGHLAMFAAWDGRTGEASALAQQALAAKVEVSRHTAVQCPAAHVALALVHLDVKELPRAERHADVAAALPDELTGSTLRAVLALTASRIRRANGDLAGARVLLAACQSGGSVPGWLTDQVRADRLILARLTDAGGVGPPGNRRRHTGHVLAGEINRRAAQAPEPLTAKEHEVLGYLAQLFTTEEIAGAMFVSVNTIRTHVRNILRKLGASRRNEAIRRARELGILTMINCA
jgi:LuxR family transcriptional regulator, maltose regulon positive regulatory protein